ncbi:MAG: hypothetical protein ACKPKO_49020, partial [Candidatus Fonsibacter sp.]
EFRLVVACDFGEPCLFHEILKFTLDVFFSLHRSRWMQIHHLSYDQQQETKTLPVGPTTTTEEWFAGSRLGMCTYVARVWSRREDTWVILLSRVLEKSSKWAIECLREAVAHCDFTQYT